MPVIKMDTTTTTTPHPPALRASLLTKMKDEFKNSTEHGPVIFEIPLGTECFDVLVVWEEWADWSSEERTALILDAYEEEKREQIAQALGVTYLEALQQQLLPYTIVSTLERNPKMASLVCGNDENEVKKLMAKIHDSKSASGGIHLPDGKVELRFPTRAMVDNVLARLKSQDLENQFYWSVIVEVAASEHIGIADRGSIVK
jgi:hypothetical protein